MLKFDPRNGIAESGGGGLRCFNAVGSVLLIMQHMMACFCNQNDNSHVPLIGL